MMLKGESKKEGIWKCFEGVKEKWEGKCENYGNGGKNEGWIDVWNEWNNEIYEVGEKKLKKMWWKKM